MIRSILIILVSLIPFLAAAQLSAGSASPSFNAEALTGGFLGKVGEAQLQVGINTGDPAGYPTESEYVEVLTSLKNGLLVRQDPHVVVKAPDGRFHIYKVSNNSTSSTSASRVLQSYSDLRNMSLDQAIPTNAGAAAVVCLASANGKLRFAKHEAVVNIAPASTPDEVVKQLQMLVDDWSRTGDHRGLFATMYLVITKRAIKELEQFRQQGNMEAADFEEKLLVNFANKYFEALSTTTPTEVWQMTLDSGRRSQNLGLKESGNIAEILALSMNAHIIHDLAIALRESNYDSEDPVHRATFDAFNQSLFEEKGNILLAIKQHYGNNVVQQANDLFGESGNWIMQNIFRMMRKVAAANSAKDHEEIAQKALVLGDAIIRLIPGGQLGEEVEFNIEEVEMEIQPLEQHQK